MINKNQFRLNDDDASNIIAATLAGIINGHAAALQGKTRREAMDLYLNMVIEKRPPEVSMERATAVIQGAIDYLLTLDNEGDNNEPKH